MHFFPSSLKWPSWRQHSVSYCSCRCRSPVTLRIFCSSSISWGGVCVCVRVHVLVALHAPVFVSPRLFFFVMEVRTSFRIQWHRKMVSVILSCIFRMLCICCHIYLLHIKSHNYEVSRGKNLFSKMRTSKALCYPLTPTCTPPFLKLKCVF